MDPLTAAEHLQRARSAIQQATAEWNPADLDRVDSSKELLVAAVGDMRIFESAILAGDVAPTAELYSTILATKQEIMHVTRLVDACVAFHRGLAARTGDAPPVYDAEGQIAREPAEVEPEVHA